MRPNWSGPTRRRCCSTTAVTAAHPRPDFKRQILAAFTNGFKDRPQTTFGTVNADVLEHFVPGFRRTDFVEVIESSAWPD
jgi:hypothetical protein